MNIYGAPPEFVGQFDDVDLKEVMYYLYLPVYMPELLEIYQIPENLVPIIPLIRAANKWAQQQERPKNEYIYVSARKGWATPDNPLNRPGWHADGFGTDDLNFVWWKGAGTRFAIKEFTHVPDDDKGALEVFEEQAPHAKIITYPEKGLYAMDQTVVHSTPLIAKGQMRQYVKITMSPHRYNLENNSHNYFFDYDWAMYPREEVRNNTFKVQKDFV